MNVEVENLPNCLASLRVELPPERVTQEWNEVVKDFRQVARIPGFRPGKAPQNVVESKFRKEIQEELTRKLVSASTKEAIREKGLRVLSVSNVEDVEFTPERSMRFTATIITAPEFELPEYKGIHVKVPPFDVSNDEVSAALERLRERHATFSDLETGVFEREAFGVINFETTANGQPLLEAIPDAPKRLASANDLWIKLQDDSVLPGFADAVAGMAAGERREFDLKVPDDFPAKSLTGQVLHFQVELKSLKRMELPELNDEFAGQVAEGVNLDELRTRLRDRVAEQKAQEVERAKRDQIVDYLNERVECELPQSYVKEETRRIMSEIVEQNQLRGVSEETLRESGKEILNVASRSAKDRLKTSFILARIGEREKIEVTAQELKRRLETLAAQYGMSYEKVRAEFEKKGAISQLIEEIQVGKVLDFLTSNANVETSSITEVKG
ncbi:MAG: trigger factor [Verrucomicrobia bacterium]|nr:trigger factor [Verrucomicrobiota bacterium]MBV9275026.1 trigger factor [Verrucomicrobiota bacterium]